MNAIVYSEIKDTLDLNEITYSTARNMKSDVALKLNERFDLEQLKQEITLIAENKAIETFGDDSLVAVKDILKEFFSSYDFQDALRDAS